MEIDSIKERIAEFAGGFPDAGTDEASLLEAALFIEDEFGIFLSDNEICEENLGTHFAIETFVRNKLQQG